MPVEIKGLTLPRVQGEQISPKMFNETMIKVEQWADRMQKAIEELRVFVSLV